MNKTLTFKKELEEINIIKDANLKYIWVGKGQDRYKGILNIIHKKPNLKSNVGIKVILYDESNFDLNGVIKISKGAINTDTYLKVDVLLLSETSHVRVVPSLEILEDNVKAGHSATVKELPINEIYYLMSRGLSETEARDMLVDAFLKS